MTEHLVFRDHHRRLYRTEIFLRTDGGSIPPLDITGLSLILAGCVLSHFTTLLAALLSMIGFLICVAGVLIKFYGRVWWSFIFHDALFKNKIEVSDDDGKTWHKMTFNESRCNSLLHEAMESQDAKHIEHGIIWAALHWFGWRAFDEDRKKAGPIKP